MARRMRLHSDDARFLRDLFYDLMARVYELEKAVGELQKKEDLVIATSPEVEIVEGARDY